RRCVFYDRVSLEARKKYSPRNTVVDMVSAIQIELLKEEQYRKLQSIEAFDLKTSSWVQTPPEIRKCGVELLCDCLYVHVFVYHNAVYSYYRSRGFRCLLRV